MIGADAEANLVPDEISYRHKAWRSAVRKAALTALCQCLTRTILSLPGQPLDLASAEMITVQSGTCPCLIASSNEHAVCVNVSLQKCADANMI